MTREGLILLLGVLIGMVALRAYQWARARVDRLTAEDYWTGPRR